ncbi:MAG: hypothetical protein OEO79_14000 [Gemmatimonadota bacterium]|nr:hypothetical protein [Gemmatimonadota bacterium]
MGLGKLEAVLDFAEGLPEWLRPVAYGPLIIAALMVSKGALVLGPVVTVVALWQSDDPILMLMTGGVILAIVFGSAAAGGLSYSMLGRPAIRLVPLGWVLAGWAAVIPYFVGLIYVLRITKGLPVLAPWVGVDLTVLGIMTAVFGTQFGIMFLRPGAID